VLLLAAVVLADPQSWGYSYQIPSPHHSFYQQPHVPLRSFYPGSSQFQTPYAGHPDYYYPGYNYYQSPYFPSSLAPAPYGVKNVNSPADSFYFPSHDEKSPALPAVDELEADDAISLISSANFKNQQRKPAASNVVFLSGRLIVAMAQGPSQFQDEFNKITKELVGDDEELYYRVQTELAPDVSEAMIASQQLISGQQVSANQEGRWLGWIKWPISKLVTWTIYYSVAIPIRLTIKLVNLVALII